MGDAEWVNAVRCRIREIDKEIAQLQKLKSVLLAEWQQRSPAPPPTDTHVPYENNFADPRTTPSQTHTPLEQSTTTNQSVTLTTTSWHTSLSSTPVASPASSAVLLYQSHTHGNAKSLPIVVSEQEEEDEEEGLPPYQWSNAQHQPRADQHQQQGVQHHDDDDDDDHYDDSRLQQQQQQRQGSVSPSSMTGLDHTPTTQQPPHQPPSPPEQLQQQSAEPTTTTEEDDPFRPQPYDPFNGTTYNISISRDLPPRHSKPNKKPRTQYRCDTCNRDFRELCSLRSHLKAKPTHTSGDVTTFKKPNSHSAHCAQLPPRRIRARQNRRAQRERERGGNKPKAAKPAKPTKQTKQLPWEASLAKHP